MTWRRLARAGAGSALAALLATATIAARQPPAAGGQIAGIVKSAADDTPIARARVAAVATDAEPRVALTGVDGRYSFSDLPAGSYIITATRTGYASRAYRQGRIAAGAVELAANQRLTNIDLVLEPGRHIVGRILDEDGTPFAGAAVEALVARSDRGQEALIAVATSRTDDRGEFRLYGLPAGRYFVSAADPAFGSVATPNGVLRYSPTYHPGVASPDQAQPVTVPDGGDPPRIEFRLRLVPPARVSGQILAPGARELLSAAILMSPLAGNGAPAGPPQEPSILPDGRFSFGHVAPGRYQIRARGQTEPAGSSLFAAFSIDVVGRDVEGLRLPLRPGAVIDGRVTVENRHGSKPPQLPTLRVRAASLDGSNFSDALTGTVEANGRFALRGVMAGPHQIVVDGLEPPWVVKQVLYRGSDISDEILAVAEREQVRAVQITIDDSGREVSGAVQDQRQQPVANAGVLVFSALPLHWMRTSRRMRLTYTDDRGRFTITGLPAGDYIAVASMQIDEADLGRHERLRALRPLGTALRLAADDARKTLTLALASPAVRVEGRTLMVRR